MAGIQFNKPGSRIVKVDGKVKFAFRRRTESPCLKVKARGQYNDVGQKGLGNIEAARNGARDSDVQFLDITG